MILVLLLLLLLNIPKELFGIYCTYSEEPYDWKLDNFNDEEFKKKIDELPSYDYEDYNVDMCRVEIYIDYKSNSLVISFGDSFPWSQLDHGEGRLDFLIVFNETNTDAEFYHLLEYACYDQNHCNKLFVFNHIQWLREVNYTLLQLNLRSILFNNTDKTEICYKDKINVLNCSTNVCSGKYSTYHKNYLFQCHQNSKAFIEVHITTNMIVTEEYLNDETTDQHKIIRYTCKFNQCNNQYVTDQLISIIETEYQLSLMKKLFLDSYSTYKNHTNNGNSFSLTQQTKVKTEIKRSSTLKTHLLNNIAIKNSYLSSVIIIIIYLVFIN